MHYVYILQSLRDQKLYIGCTSNLRARFALHNKGKVPSTKNRFPLKMIYYEVFLEKHDAFTREQWLKTGWGKNQISKMLDSYFKKQNNGT